MDQTNPLAELTSQAPPDRPSGPGGLSRERAGFDVRDVHHSHYGRICPIETPEGPNIGLIGSLATYGRINAYGFIETPYRKVKRTVAHDDPQLPTYEAGADLVGQGRQGHPQEGRAVHRGRRTRSSRARRRSRSRSARSSPTRSTTSRPTRRRSTTSPRRTRRSTTRTTSSASACRAATGTRSRRRARTRSSTWTSAPSRSSRVATALIPFLEHDDANRALMGSNMQRQAVPLLEPESADRRHRHGGARRARLRPGRHRPPRGRRDQRHRRAGPGRGRLGRAGRVPAAQVRAQQPGHLHQPAPDRHGRPAGRRRRRRSPTRRPPTAASSRSAGTSWWRS